MIHRGLVWWKLGFSVRACQWSTMSKMLKPQKSDTVLDLGCGYGYLSWEIAKNRSTIVALDLSRPYLERAFALLNGRCHFILASATDLPFRDQVFNKVVMSSVLQHVFEYKKALKEVSRILKPEGTFVVNVPSDKLYLYLPQLFRKSYRKVQDTLFKHFNLQHLFSTDELASAVNDTGLKVIDLEYSPKFVTALLFEMTLFFEIMIENPIVSFLLSPLYIFTRAIESILPHNCKGTEFNMRIIKRSVQ